MAKITELHVNGACREVDADSQTSLLTVLRDQLDLTGSKYGCGEGQCGACTVLINGLPRRSCITPVDSAVEKQITTIEGLAQNGRLHPLQQAFLEEGALQCGYCTSGMILGVVALLNEKPHPTESEIVSRMQKHLCRCCSYPTILKAIRRAAATPHSTKASL